MLFGTVALIEAVLLPRNLAPGRGIILDRVLALFVFSITVVTCPLLSFNIFGKGWPSFLGIYTGPQACTVAHGPPSHFSKAFWIAMHSPLVGDN